MSREFHLKRRKRPRAKFLILETIAGALHAPARNRADQFWDRGDGVTTFALAAMGVVLGLALFGLVFFCDEASSAG